MAKKKTTTNINKCQFSNTVSLSSAQNSNVTNSVFNGPLQIGPGPKSYCERDCYRKEDHKMFKALNMGCPCTDVVPLMVTDAKSDKQVRVYYDDVVFFDSKGEFDLSLRDTMNMVKKQQKTIERLEKEVKSLKRKSKK